jgi:hypothetical protein
VCLPAGLVFLLLLKFDRGHRLIKGGPSHAPLWHGRWHSSVTIYLFDKKRVERVI